MDIETSSYDDVLFDTAPTGHTILLPDADEAYHREVLRQLGDMPETVRELPPRLRDPRFTRILLATLAEATPVHKAARLQADLARAGITPLAWVINQALSPHTLQVPVLQSRKINEQPYIREATGEQASRTVLIPWLPHPPAGSDGLFAMLREGQPAFVGRAADSRGRTLFLIYGIVRPEAVSEGPQTLLLQERAFPGSELAHLSDIIREAELTGFEVLDVED